MKYSYALFDLDGTLTDPSLGITNCIMYALKKFGIAPPPREELYKFIGPPLLYSFKEYCGFSEKDAELAVSYYRERFSEVGLFENEIYPGIKELLSELCENGTRVVLATSKPDVYSKRILEHFDIDKYFYFLAANTLAESRPEKSDVIAYAIESCKIKTPREAVMVGDRKYDILGGKTFGLVTVGVSYGFGGREELLLSGADKIADTVEELRGIIAG